MRKDLSGFGVGYRPPHYQSITATRTASLDWLEVISENFMGRASGPRRILEKLRQDFPIAIHGVSLSIGSLSPLNKNYLNRLKELVTFVEPGIVSDHLCWTEHAGKNSHDLLPMSYTKASLRNISEKVSYLQDFLNRQIILENPSAYVGFVSDEMSEAQFFTELCKKTGCGILLDINNVYVNFNNLGADPEKYLFDLPKESVKQFHLAGHSYQGKAIIDTHDHPVVENVWRLFEIASHRWPKIPTLIEWDDKIPEFEVLMKEVKSARARHNLAKPNDKKLELEKTSRLTNHQENIEKLHETFFTSVTSLNDIIDNGVALLNPTLPVSAEQGLLIYKNAYFLRIESVLKEIYPTLHWVLEDEGFSEMALAYLRVYPSQHYSITYTAEKLPEFLTKYRLDFEFGAPQEVLRDIARIEWAKSSVFEMPPSISQMKASDLQKIKPEEWESVSFQFSKNLEILELDWDIDEVIQKAELKEQPPLPKQEQCRFLVWQKHGHVRHRKIEKSETDFLNVIRQKTFKEACHVFAGTTEENANKGLTYLMGYITDELIDSQSI